MPRNGSGTYSKPSGTTFVAQTTIQSAKMNELIDDMVVDLNTARPVVAGGTGASTVAGARNELGVDQSVSLSAKSADYTAVGTDNNKVIRFSAAAVLSLTAAATLGSGWHVSIMADGGAVGIDPNGSETINGATTGVIPQGFSATIICDGSGFRTVNMSPIKEDGFASAFRNYLTGYTLSNNGSDATNDIDIAAGSCTDSTNSYVITLTSGVTKRLDALWAVGTAQGGLDTGSVSNTTYHVFAIKRLDTGVVDILFSTSASSPTLPTSYTVFRRIGSIVRRSDAILGFAQDGDEFLLNVPILDVDATTGSVAALSRTLTVPLGIKVSAMIRARGTNASNWGVLISSPDVPDTAPNITDAPGVDIGASAGTGDRATLTVRTNTSAEIRTRNTATSQTLQIVTYGWIDRRGK